MSLRRRIGLGVAVLSAAVLWWALQPAPRPVDVVRVQRGALTQRFEEEARTELAHRWIVAAPIAGTLRRIGLLQGDRVKQGQLLARIEPMQAQLLDPANRERLLAEERAAQASMQAARQRQAAAQADADLASRDVARMRRLGAGGVVSAAALDEVEARVLHAQAAVAAAAADYRAFAQQRAALAALLSGQGMAGGRTVPVIAPIDGVVLHRYQQSATPVQAGQPLLELGDLRKLQVMAQVLSQQATLLRPGTPARILRWGGEGTLAARVARIEPGGYTKVSALGVEEQRTQVWLDIVAPRAQWERLGDGYRVEVAFDVARREDVLKVEASALFRQGARWAVYRVDGNRLRLAYVEPGMQGGTEAEIREGLREGDRVVAFPDDRMGEGMRVQALEQAAAATR
ncbi:efflux RND transporter periplasmic adaptor subunit [Frateuria soli]|uniref:efflux RND transporter periplasmic adaptor subunit n=1 Tax=Frateuria soli TaxID=1542730 RepID=UPI001E4CE0B8|nr:HlyD family efflux transporter periplasmic adaptor subunit [Frateuria soli]UGB39556.1 HlyD family efflux transporter periplasmic adaptor subunit [Frateuria soli]